MSKYKAPALGKGLDIIDLITLHEALSFNDIQVLTKDNPASLSRYLHTLIEKNYLYKNHEQKYELGYKLMPISNPKSLWPKLIHRCEPFMEAIHKTYGISALLIAYTNDIYTAIEKKTAVDNLAMMEKHTVNQNQIYSMWSSLYYTIKHIDELNEVLEKFRDFKTAICVHDLWQEAQTQGYIALHAMPQDILRMGFPVFCHNRVVATLGFGTLANQLSESQKEAIIKSSLIMTTELSKELTTKV